MAVKSGFTYREEHGPFGSWGTPSPAGTVLESTCNTPFLLSLGSRGGGEAVGWKMEEMKEDKKKSPNISPPLFPLARFHASDCCGL